MPVPFEKYELLKEAALLKITPENYKDRLKNLKSLFIWRLKNLDINNITQIENFYLIGAQLNKALSLKIAEELAIKNHMKLNDCRMLLVGTQEIENELIDFFKQDDNAIYFFKFAEIEWRWKPAKQGWAAMQDRYARIYAKLIESEDFMFNLLNKHIDFFEREEEKLIKNKQSHLASSVHTLVNDLKSMSNHINKDKEQFCKILVSTHAQAQKITDLSTRWKILEKFLQAMINLFSKESTTRFYLSTFFSSPIKESTTRFYLSTFFSSPIKEHIDQLCNINNIYNTSRPIK